MYDSFVSSRRSLPQISDGVHRFLELLCLCMSHTGIVYTSDLIRKVALHSLGVFGAHSSVRAVIPHPLRVNCYCLAPELVI